MGAAPALLLVEATATLVADALVADALPAGALPAAEPVGLVGLVLEVELLQPVVVRTVTPAGVQMP